LPEPQDVKKVISEVTVFFGSRGVNAGHKEKINEIKWLSSQPEEEKQKIMAPMMAMNLPLPEEMVNSIFR